MNPSGAFFRLLHVLTHHEVEFIVVGGVAAIIEGAPVSTFDLDIVYLVSEQNIDRLAGALEELEAVYRDPAGRHIEPNRSRLRSLERHLLRTKYRPLDVLRTIGSGQDYEDLIGRTRERKLGELRLRVLELSAVIESKEQANRDKDRATLPVLRQTLHLKRETPTES